MIFVSRMKKMIPLIQKEHEYVRRAKGAPRKRHWGSLRSEGACSIYVKEQRTKLAHMRFLRTKGTH